MKTLIQCCPKVFNCYFGHFFYIHGLTYVEYNIYFYKAMARMPKLRAIIIYSQNALVRIVTPTYCPYLAQPKQVML